jgi:uncharacterized membrane protein (DUF4010 family)
MAAGSVTFIDPVILNLAVALGVGLLIGAERERRKGDGPSRSPAGIRTFTITSLAGAVSVLIGGELLLAIATLGVIALTALAYWRARDDDPGLTTEIGLILTVLLGGLSMRQPALAAGLAATVAIVFAARSPLHRFVRGVLTEDEVKDALIFAGTTLVVLPLLPDQPMGPYGALNPHTIWLIVILVMAISAAGYVAVRMLGTRFGLPLAGLASGFISSTATIGAMGVRAAQTPDVLGAAVAALLFALILSGIMIASAALREWFDETGIIVAAAVAGFADTHSAAISVASLVASGKMNAVDAGFPILAGLSTNTLSKMILACTSGGRSFAFRVLPGLMLVALAAWAGMLISG